jgi:hypothetical protein
LKPLPQKGAEGAKTKPVIFGALCAILWPTFSDASRDQTE